MKLGVACPRTWMRDRGIGRTTRWILAVGLFGMMGCSELPVSMTGKVPVDCIGLIDLEKDNVAGKWTKDDSGNLKSITAPFGRVQVPYIPGAEYDVKVAAQRTAGSDGLVIGLTKGANQFAVVIDGATKAVATGVDQMDKKTFTDNELAVKKTFFTDKVCNILVQVRDISFVINIDGNDVVTWKDKEKVKNKDTGKEEDKETGKPLDYSRFSLIPNWKNPLGKCIFLGAFSEFTISSFQVINQKGGGKYLR
jgi:hypothetical protein